MALLELLAPEAVEVVDGAVVKKSNEFVTANVDDMTLKEAQLLALAISKIPQDAKQNPKENIRITISRREFDLIFQLNGQSMKKLETLCQKLQTRVIVVRRRNAMENITLYMGTPDVRAVGDDWKRMVIVPTCEYRAGSFHLTLNADLNEHFFSLMSSFTSYNLVNIVGLSSNHHIRLYEFNMMMIGVKQKPIPIDEFRTLMGVSGKYQRFNNLRYKVIEPAIQSINKYTDIDITYTLIRKEFEVTDIEFSAQKKTHGIMLMQGDEESTDEKTKSETRMFEHLRALNIPDAEITVDQASQIVSVHDGSEDEFYHSVAAAMDYIAGLVRKGKLENGPGIVFNAIKQKWKRKKQAENQNQQSLNLEPAKEKPKPDPVDVEQMLVKLEQDEALLAEYIEYLHRIKHYSLLDIIPKDGIRGTRMVDEITDFWKIKKMALPLV